MPFPLQSLSRRIRHGGARAAAAGGAALAGAALLLTPRPAAAQGELYEMCLQVVDDLAGRCMNATDNILADFACMWLGGVGYIVCAILEAIRQLLPGGYPTS